MWSAVQSIQMSPKSQDICPRDKIDNFFFVSFQAFFFMILWIWLVEIHEVHLLYRRREIIVWLNFGLTVVTA